MIWYSYVRTIELHVGIVRSIDRVNHFGQAFTNTIPATAVRGMPSAGYFCRCLQFCEGGKYISRAGYYRHLHLCDGGGGADDVDEDASTDDCGDDNASISDDGGDRKMMMAAGDEDNDDDDDESLPESVLEEIARLRSTMCRPFFRTTPPEADSDDEAEGPRRKRGKYLNQNAEDMGANSVEVQRFYASMLSAEVAHCCMFQFWQVLRLHLPFMSPVVPNFTFFGIGPKKVIS